MTHRLIPVVTGEKFRVTKVTFTAVWGGPSIHLVVWQFWGGLPGVLSLYSSGRFFCSQDGGKIKGRKLAPDQPDSCLCDFSC
jgi:hypothetical protein